MRSFVPALLLALAITPFTAEIAFCQPDEVFEGDFIEEAPVRTRPVGRRGRGFNTPLTWAVITGVLVVAVPLGVFKIVRQMQGWHAQQDREKAPWERAQADFERERAANQKRPDAF